MVSDLPKRKTTILIDEKVWRNLLSYTVKKYGTAKKTSIEIENAIKAYLEKSLKS
jgi:hypothetical protein